MYTDDTILSKGRYKFTALCRIPPNYFLNILRTQNQSDPELYQYAKDNLESIQSRLKGEINSPELVLACHKTIFHSEKAAKIALDKIKGADSESPKRPIRAYECDECGGFHLTSWSLELYQENKKKVNNK